MVYSDPRFWPPFSSSGGLSARLSGHQIVNTDNIILTLDNKYLNVEEDPDIFFPRKQVTAHEHNHAFIQCQAFNGLTC